MSDLIDRQAAIDAVYETFCYAYCDNCDKEMNEDLCGDCHRKYNNWAASKATIERVINALPSVQPEPLTLRVNSELTKEEYDKLMQDIKDAPIVLLPYEQPDRKTGEWLHDLLQDAIDAGIITETQAIGIMWRAQHKGAKD